MEYRTKTIKNTTEPQWNEVCVRYFFNLLEIFLFKYKVFEFVVEQSESDSVEFEVYDEDPGSDDFIGK
jgi:hypothetical protein